MQKQSQPNPNQITQQRYWKFLNNQKKFPHLSTPIFQRRRLRNDEWGKAVVIQGRASERRWNQKQLIRSVEEGLVLASRRCEGEKETKESLRRKLRETLKQRHIKKKGNKKKGRKKNWIFSKVNVEQNCPNGIHGGNKGVYLAKYQPYH